MDEKKNNKIAIALSGDADKKCTKSRKRIHVIINPIAGVKGKESISAEIAAYLEKKCYEVDVSYTQARYHATDLAKKAVSSGAEVVAVVGGDGTVNEVAQTLIGTSASLAIIPCGSGNGLARHLHIPLDIAQSLALLETGRVKSIDSVRLNERAYFGVAGIGFDAEVGWSFSEAGYRGFCAYLFAALKKLPFYRSQQYHLLLDKIPITRIAFLICIANSSQFGNGAYISPEAQIDDGLLDVVILKKFPLFSLPHIAYHLFHGTLHEVKYVEIIRCKEVSILQSDLKAHIDGEPAFFPNGIQGYILPSSLKILIP